MVIQVNGMSEKRPSGIDGVGVIRNRIHEVQDSDPRATQASLAAMLNRSQAWVSSFLLQKPEESLRNLWVENPDYVKKFLGFLRWSADEFTTFTGIALPGGIVEVSGGESLYRFPVYSAALATSVDKGEPLREVGFSIQDLPGGDPAWVEVYEIGDDVYIAEETVGFKSRDLIAVLPQIGCRDLDPVLFWWDEEKTVVLAPYGIDRPLRVRTFEPPAVRTFNPNRSGKRIGRVVLRVSHF